MNTPVPEPKPVAPERGRCRLKSAPPCLLAAFLTLDAFLWSSEHFRWFAFNEHKGWTVLIAVASVGVFLLLMFLWFLAALLFRLRF